MERGFQFLLWMTTSELLPQSGLSLDYKRANRSLFYYWSVPNNKVKVQVPRKKSVDMTVPIFQYTWLNSIQFDSSLLNFPQTMHLHQNMIYRIGLRRPLDKIIQIQIYTHQKHKLEIAIYRRRRNQNKFVLKMYKTYRGHLVCSWRIYPQCSPFYCLWRLHSIYKRWHLLSES